MRQDLGVLPKLATNFHPLASASQVDEITGMYHYIKEVMEDFGDQIEISIPPMVPQRSGD